MPYKTFTAGSSATSSDAQTYFMNQAVITCTSGTRPAAPIEGMTIYETDTDKVLIYDGAVWNLPKNVAGGSLGYAQVTANQTGITTEVDLTGLSVTVTVGAGRRIRITGSIQAQSSVANDNLALRIKEGTTVLQTAQVEANSANQSFVIERNVVLSPTTGAHTYKLSLQRIIGTGTALMEAFVGGPASITVEDVGV